MIFVYKSEYDIFRYAVAKLVFLKLYNNNYKFVRDFKKTNCMEVIDNYSKNIIVSLFGKPYKWSSKKDNKNNLPVYSFILKEHKRKSYENCSILTQQFEDMFDEYFYYAIFESAHFKKIFEASDYVELYNKIISETFIIKDMGGKIYRYYDYNKVANNKYNILDGKISFNNPINFNDPFDCVCKFKNGSDATNKIRVFCSSPDNKDILMWSYYAEQHKGYCIEYSKEKIIEELAKIPNCTCILGKVSYDFIRPNYHLYTNDIKTSIRQFINCTFTKAKIWEHEKEYRIVLFLDTDTNYYRLQSQILNIYEGCKTTATILIDSKGIVHSTIKLHTDPIDYKLN